ncbi:Ig-like domain-containing protein [Pseudomonas sp. RT6P73]
MIPAERETNAHIAARFGVSESTLTTLQNQASQAGWAGQAILIPRHATGESRLYPAYGTHTLAKGETLGSLALKVNRSELELRKLNTLVLGDTALKNLKEGDVFLIPAPVPVNRIGKGVDTKKNQQDFEMLLANAALQAGEGYKQQVRGRSAPANFLAHHSVSTATNTATRAISSGLEEVLKPFGRAQVGVQVSTRANSLDLNLDYLHPLLQSNDDILFAQIGSRTFDDRNIANLGLGYRRQINPGLMLGGNAFIDQDFSRSHTRAGFGTEVWGNTARLASNTYVPVSGWRKSDQHRLNSDPNRMNLFERPASGWDARAETLIPGVPQLAATAQYFQWSGKGVDAFGGGKLKTDPAGYGVGVRWQPIPLIGVISEHQKLDGGNGQFKFGIDFNWRFDQDLYKQLNPAGSIAIRPLAQAKQNFVDRNYNIILNYKQEAKYHAFGFTSKSVAVQANPLLASPVSQPSPMLSGTPASGIVRYELANNSQLVTIDPLSGVITAAPGAETQHVTVIARLYMPRIASLRKEVGVVETWLASAGNVLRAATAFLIPTVHAADLSSVHQHFLEVANDSYHLEVLEGQPLIAGSIELQIINDRSPANGSSQNIVEAMVKDEAGSPISSAEVSFTLDSTITRGTQVAMTDADGLARLSFSSSIAGKMAVTGQANSKTHAVDVYFIPDVISAHIDLKVNKETAMVGKDDVTLSGMLIDGNRNPVEGVAVGLVATNEAMIVRSVITDAEGSFSVKLQGSKAGKTEVTARIDGDDASTDTVSVFFVADTSTATLASGNLVVSSNGALANGAASNAVTATVTDAHGNPLAAQSVAFTASNGATIDPSAVTNDQGQVQVTLTNTKAGVSTVTATVNGQAVSVDTTFIADTSTATLASGNLVVSSNGALANGAASNAVTATVTDAHGNPLAAQSVAFTASNGATIDPSAVTNDQGQVQVTLTNTKAGVSTVTATVNGQAVSVDTTFVADTGTATLASGNLVVSSNGALASGIHSNAVTATVTDAHGNPLAAQNVAFTASNGATIDASAVTNDQGQAQVTLTNTKAGISTVTTTVNGQAVSVDTTFVADTSTATLASGNLVVSSNGALANGIHSNAVTATVTDAHGNPLAAQNVAFTASNGATIDASAVTNDQGQVQVTLTNTKAGVSTVTATVNGQAVSVDTTFVADTSTATLASGNLVVSSNGALASGIHSNAVTATVTDAHGNPLTAQSVAFTASNGATIDASAVTNDQGQVQVTLTNTKAGVSTVTATVNGQAVSVDTTFVAVLEIVPNSGLAAQILTVGQPSINVKPFHVIGGKGEIRYSSEPLPAGLLLNTSSGFVSGSPTVEQTATDINFKATDTDGAVIDFNVSFTVNAATTASANTAAQLLQEGSQAPEFQPLTASGGRPPYVYSVASGTLPQGMSLNADTGVVSGIPTPVSAASITFQVRDANGVTATTTSTVSYSVAQIFSAILDHTAQLLKVDRQAPEFQPLTASGGHLLPGQCYAYSVAAGILPAGMLLDTCTGKVTGTPTTLSGATSVTFQVKDAAGSNMAATVDVRYSVVAVLISEFVKPQADPKLWREANRACVESGAKLPSQSELRSIFNSYTSGGTNYDMCLKHGWPLGPNSTCGGLSPNYWTRDEGTSGAISHFVFRMHNGTNDTGGVDHSKHHYACIH